MVTVKISKTLLNEYESRDVFSFVQNVGDIELTEEQARELLEDAEFQADRKSGPEEMPEFARRAYICLRDRLKY